MAIESHAPIMGGEIEWGHTELNRALIPAARGFVPNGGRIYIEGRSKHLEYSMPEVSNAYDALVYDRAGERLCAQIAPFLIKNNTDFYGNSFGYHENHYFFGQTTAINSLEPFFVTRPIFTGAGRLAQNFELTQRAEFIDVFRSPTANSSRGVIIDRRERIRCLPGYRRIQIIYGDSNRCDRATFLKYGATSLVVRLAEQEQLPHLPITLDNPIGYFKSLSRLAPQITLQPYQMQRIREFNEALQIQHAYLDRCEEVFGKDDKERRVLDVWRDTLKRLEQDPQSLIGKLDWISKGHLLRLYQGQYHVGYDELRAYELSYHRISDDPELSSFTLLRDLGYVEDLVSKEEVWYAMTNPPKDTRACLRGKVISGIKELEPQTVSLDISWHSIAGMSQDGEPFSVMMLDPTQNYLTEYSPIMDRFNRPI